MDATKAMGLFGPEIALSEFDRLQKTQNRDLVNKCGATLLTRAREELMREEQAKDEGYNYGHWHKAGNQYVELLDHPIAEMDPKMCENFNPETTMKQALLQEDLQFDANTGLYTTLIASFIEQAIKPQLVMTGCMKTLTGINPAGGNAIKIPIQVNHAAGILGDDGDIATSRTATDYSSDTLTAVWYYTSTGITEELLRHSTANLMQDQMTNMGWAHGLKIDDVIIAAIETAAPIGDGNNNYVALGATTAMNWDDLVTAIADMQITASTSPTKLVTNPNTWAAMLKDDDIRTAVQYASEAGKIAPGMNPHMPGVTTQLLGLDVIVTPRATAKATYLIDPNYAGYFAPFVPLQVVDGRISGKLSTEVVAYIAYAAKYILTGSVYQIRDTTA